VCVKERELDTSAWTRAHHRVSNVVKWFIFIFF
jgi:hypothetical protein